MVRRLASRDSRPGQWTGADGSDRHCARRLCHRGPVVAHREAVLFELSFRTVARSRPVALVSPGFETVRIEEPVVGELELGPSAPPVPWTAVEMDVRRGDGTLVAGLAGDAGHVLGSYDTVTGRATIEVGVAGRTTVVRSGGLRLPRPLARAVQGLRHPDGLRFAVAVCENRVTVLLGTALGWTPLLSERREVAQLLDLRRPSTLTGLRHAYGVRGGRTEVASVRAGVFGMVGVRDLHVVQDADGSPHVRDGKAWLTATCAGLGSFRQAHWGVFTLDLDDPVRLQQVAHLFTARDGLVLGDHAGQLVRDDDQWVVAASSWGDFAGAGVHVRHTATPADVLRGVHVLPTERTPLPTTLSTWDPGATRIDGRWWVGFVESPSQAPFDFHPALAAGPVGGRPWEGLERQGADPTLHHCEGPLLTEVDGRWWLLASDATSRCYPAYDLGMRRVGRLDAPYLTNIPHPQLVPLPDGSQLLVTFDGTPFGGRAGRRLLGYGGHGDLVVMRSGPDRGAG